MSLDNVRLQALIDKKENGVIYAFSPGMHLSVEGIAPFISLSEKLHLSVTIALDPNFKQDLNKWRSKLGIKPEKILLLRSQDLFFRGMGIHYPCIIAYSKTGLLSGIYPGRKSDAEYTEYIKSYLNETK